MFCYYSLHLKTIILIINNSNVNNDVAGFHWWRTISYARTSCSKALYQTLLCRPPNIRRRWEGLASETTMDYSPWSSKNLINQNQLKKFMQVGVDVKCMHTNFGGQSLFSFGDIGTFKNGQFSLSDYGL